MKKKFHFSRSYLFVHEFNMIMNIKTVELVFVFSWSGFSNEEGIIDNFKSFLKKLIKPINLTFLQTKISLSRNTLFIIAEWINLQNVNEHFLNENRAHLTNPNRSFQSMKEMQCFLRLQISIEHLYSNLNVFRHTLSSFIDTYWVFVSPKLININRILKYGVLWSRWHVPEYGYCAFLRTTMVFVELVYGLLWS